LEKVFAQGRSPRGWTIPTRHYATLKEKAPTVPSGRAKRPRLSWPVVVGSRNIDAAGTQYAAEIGRRGGCRRWLSQARAERSNRDERRLAGGLPRALADSLEATIRKPGT
jgi:hypothetical protein